MNKAEKYDLMRKYDINEEVISDMIYKYKAQKNHCSPTKLDRKLDANKVPVEFLMTFMEWAELWLDSGHWHERGCKKGDYCTMRKDDIGPYEDGNVTIGLHGENVSDAHKGSKHTAETKAKMGVAKKGAGNPKADHTIRHFINKKSAETFTGTRIQLQEAYPECNWDRGNLSRILNPNHKNKTHCGWSVI